MRRFKMGVPRERPVRQGQAVSCHPPPNTLAMTPRKAAMEAPQIVQYPKEGKKL